MRRGMLRYASALLAGLLGAGLWVPAATAEEAKPDVLTFAWYWESQQNQSVEIPEVGEQTAEVPSPFCPAIPGTGGQAVADTCAEGRLPVEVVEGDYEEPDKISAVNFDMTVLVPGSEVTKFTATFLEAKSGCYEKDNATTGQQCEQTDPINIEGRELQACLVTDFFGEGEARPYKERPKFECSPTDPVAKRKAVESKDPDGEVRQDHVWTFDLTEMAQQWVDEQSFTTSILIAPRKPKEVERGDNWRVVLAGPKFEGGVKTQLVYEPGEVDTDLPPTDTPPPVGSDDPFGSGSGFTDVGSGSLSGTGGDDFGGAPAEDTVPGEDVPAAEEAPGLEAAGDDLPEVVNVPGYMWLAVLAGIVGFLMVRSIVIESTRGPRPDGVLAQIKSLNARNRGVEPGATGAGALAGISSGFKSLGQKLSSLMGKLTNRG